MNRILYFLIPITMLTSGCNSDFKENKIEQWKNEIIKTEKNLQQ